MLQLFKAASGAHGPGHQSHGALGAPYTPSSDLCLLTLSFYVTEASYEFSEVHLYRIKDIVKNKTIQKI